MTVLTHVAATPTSARMPMLGLLRALLLSEAVLGVGLAAYLSVLANGLGDPSETTIRFAAGGAFLFGLFAAIASRGVRRRRAWGWTMAAMLQVLLAIGTGIAVMAAEWHPSYLTGFGLAAAVMLVLCASSVRRALDQA